MAVLLGSLGVLGFSFSLPATRLAVEQLDPTFVGFGRAVVAATLRGAVADHAGPAAPARDQLVRLAIVALGVVIGFPLLTALALREVTSAHGAVIVGPLPAATAVMAVLRAGERPTRAFWAASVAGLVAVLVFAATQGAAGSSWPMACCWSAWCLRARLRGGGRARPRAGRLADDRWALILAMPVVAPVAAIAAVSGDLSGDGNAWFGFAYVSVVSMFLAFFAWYGGARRGAASPRSARSSSLSPSSRSSGRPLCSARPWVPPPWPPRWPCS